MRLVGSGANAVGACIYRREDAGDLLPEAPTVSHALYVGDEHNSPLRAMRCRGIVELSQGGAHTDWQLVLPFGDDAVNPYRLPLLQLGQWVEVLDDKSLGRAVVTGVKLAIEESGEVYQTVNLVRFDSFIGIQ